MFTYVLQQEQLQWYLMDNLLLRKNSSGLFYLLIGGAISEQFLLHAKQCEKWSGGW